MDRIRLSDSIAQCRDIAHDHIRMIDTYAQGALFPHHQRAPEDQQQQAAPEDDHHHAPDDYHQPAPEAVHHPTCDTQDHIPSPHQEEMTYCTPYPISQDTMTPPAPRKTWDDLIYGGDTQGAGSSHVEPRRLDMGDWREWPEEGLQRYQRRRRHR